MGLKREWSWVGDIIEKSNHPVLTVVGNHDGLTKGKDIYGKMFGDLNYSFVYKDVKFVMWNNNFYEWHDVALEWLEEKVSSHDRVVVMSHQPPYSGTMTHAHEEKWKSIRSLDGYVASVHGHVHNFNYHFEEDTKTMIYTVDRVTGTHFALLNITEEGINIENCTPECITEARVLWEDL
jgi:Icc-related predicted phosphoesterase